MRCDGWGLITIPPIPPDEPSHNQSPVTSCGIGSLLHPPEKMTMSISKEYFVNELVRAGFVMSYGIS